MNKNIEEVIEIEKQAQALSEAAVREAEKLPVRAQDEAQTLLEKVRIDAQRDSEQLLKNAGAEQECSQILSEAEQKANENKAMAAKHMEQAINFVIDRVIGKG
jgi:vacuolar-type H+-ATPase subunit H